MCRHGCIPISDIKILGFHKSFLNKVSGSVRIGSLYPQLRSVKILLLAHRGTTKNQIIWKFVATIEAAMNFLMIIVTELE